MADIWTVRGDRLIRREIVSEDERYWIVRQQTGRRTVPVLKSLDGHYQTADEAVDAQYASVGREIETMLKTIEAKRAYLERLRAQLKMVRRGAARAEEE